MNLDAAAPKPGRRLAPRAPESRPRLLASYSPQVSRSSDSSRAISSAWRLIDAARLDVQRSGRGRQRRIESPLVDVDSDADHGKCQPRSASVFDSTRMPPVLRVADQQIVRPAHVDIQPGRRLIASRRRQSRGQRNHRQVRRQNVRPQQDARRKAPRRQPSASCDRRARAPPSAHRQKRQTHAAPHRAPPPSHRCWSIRLQEKNAAFPRK